MDSLTQIALGAAVGEAVLGRQVGRRAAAWGAVCGTLPDLDVLVPFTDAVADFTYHRSATHSLLMLALLTPLVVWLIVRVHPQTRSLRYRWAILVYLVFATHVLLDALTIYGTQLFWPLSELPFGLGSIFIIDPLYTLPLLIGVGVALFLGNTRGAYRANIAGLVLSCLYLAWGVGAQRHVQSVAENTLSREGIAYQQVLAIPTPFNSLLWRIIAVDESHYHVAYHSLLDGHQGLQIRRLPRRPELLDELREHWPVRRLEWFTGGYYATERRGDRIVVSDLRMGVEPDYAFQFEVGRISNPHPVPVSPSIRIESAWDRDRLRRLLARVVDPGIDPF